VADDHFPGPWVDETDIQPTIMYLTGLHDLYEPDGRVITQILSHPNNALAAHGVTALGECQRGLEVGRDKLAGVIKGELEAAAFGDRPAHSASAQLFACQKLIQAAQHLDASTG
jgi:hypothetical protein